MGVTVHSLKGKEWVEALSSSKKFINEFPLYYTVLLDFIKYIDDEFESWSRYYIKLDNYFKQYAVVTELYFLNTLGKDKIWNFISEHKGEFGLWLRGRGDDYILKSIKEYNHSIMDLFDNWFNKEDDMFVSLCCKFIRYITMGIIHNVDIDRS